MGVRIDLTDVTLVSGDTFRRLYWCDPVDPDDPDDPDDLDDLDESYQVMKVIKRWKLSNNEGYLVMKVI